MRREQPRANDASRSSRSAWKIGGWLRNRTPDRQVTTVFGTACRPFSGTIQCWTSRQESNLRITRVRSAELFL
jgi:hypothetical protein